MPLHRRLPKRGFNKWRPEHFNEINTGALQKAVDDGILKAGQSVDVGALIEAGMLRRPKDGLRVLGHGDLKAKLAITANHASASAKTAIEKAGGSVKLIVKKVLEADVAKAKKTAAKKAAKLGGTAKKAGKEATAE